MSKRHIDWGAEIAALARYLESRGLQAHEGVSLMTFATAATIRGHAEDADDLRDGLAQCVIQLHRMSGIELEADLPGEDSDACTQIH